MTIRREDVKVPKRWTEKFYKVKDLGTREMIQPGDAKQIIEVRSEFKVGKPERLR